MVDHHRSSFLLLLLLLSLVLFLDCVVAKSGTTRFDERLTLLRLRSTLGLRGTDWPIKGDPCRAWRGIQCNSNGSIVVGINISGFRRTRLGKQNPRFSVDPLVNLTSLAYFNASGFALPGSLPDWFGVSLSTTLRVLDLSSCSVSGVVPVTLGNLTTLRNLNLSGNSLTGLVPSSLGGLLSLSELDLSGNSLTGTLPPSFGSLLNLTSLDVSANYLTGPIPPGVGLLSKLRYLNLSSNSFSSSIPPELGDLVNLVVLDLSINSLSGSVPKEFRKLTNLREMVVSDNLLSGGLPDDLFSGNNSQLQSLVLRENGFSGTLPDVYWSLPRLKILDIAKNNFTGMLPNSSSGPNQTNAEMVDISSNSFYGELTRILTRFSAMDLSGNYFEGKVPDYVLRANASLTRNCLQNEKRQKSSEDCSLFYTSKGLDFDDFGRPNTTRPTSEKASSGISHRTVVIILAAVGGGIGFILVFILSPILVALWLHRRRSRGVNNDRPKPVNEASQPPKGGQTFDLSRLGNAFALEQLLQATEEFNDANLIKHGHSGSLFRGVLENGTPVVIKNMDMKESKNEGYISELEVLSKAGDHQRLVPLLGHCLENESQKVLVYKYMRNGDLGSALFRKSDSEGGDGLKSLDWITRLKIALGAAEGLAYLHHECSPPLVHRGVQASSILLDDKFEVRLGSLSQVYAQGDVYQSRISRLLRLPQSTEASSSANATCAYDVYCFGKVLLELVTGKLGISSPDNAEAKAYMEEALKYISTNEKELVTKILDPSLMVDEDLLEEVWAMAIIAKSCLNPKPTRRPLMRHIVNALENPLKVVREDNNSGSGGSSRFRTNSSRGSWNAAIFGSWRQSASDVQAGGTTSGGGGGGGNGNSGSQGSSGRNNNNGNSSSRRRQSSEIVPEPAPYGEHV